MTTIPAQFEHSNKHYSSQQHTHTLEVPHPLAAGSRHTLITDTLRTAHSTHRIYSCAQRATLCQPEASHILTAVLVHAAHTTILVPRRADQRQCCCNQGSGQGMEREIHLAPGGWDNGCCSCRKEACQTQAHHSAAWPEKHRKRMHVQDPHSEVGEVLSSTCIGIQQIKSQIHMDSFAR